MSGKDVEQKTILFRSQTAKRDSPASSKPTSKPKALKHRKNTVPDSVEDAFFRLADQIANEDPASATRLRQQQADQPSSAAELLWKELQLEAERTRDPCEPRTKREGGKSSRKSKTADGRKKAA
jgi:hypothetical protein